MALEQSLAYQSKHPPSNWPVSTLATLWRNFVSRRSNLRTTGVPPLTELYCRWLLLATTSVESCCKLLLPTTTSVAIRLASQLRKSVLKSLDLRTNRSPPLTDSAATACRPPPAMQGRLTAARLANSLA
ncbi:hypothetical protein VE02_05706 [Pseudogymnoascus sp. 03VT05]|nr:hypothetical protein VE02_05706 [Pseudogymnoascus sp. 03VT05]